MTIAITETQIHELNDWGWTVLENVLAGEELEQISSAMDEVADHLRQERGVESKESVSCRNGLARHAAFLALLDHPKILPLVVDALGWNIQNRDSVFDYAAPLQDGSNPKRLKLGWHFDYEEEFAGTTVDGVMPLLDFKVGWYISDHTEPGHSNILMVRGSYKWDRNQRSTWEEWLNPDEIVQIRVPAGSAMLWRPTTLHSVTPNLSENFRKAFNVSYSPRWIKPSGYIEQNSDLIAHSSPIRRQLLGSMGHSGNPLGSEPTSSPESQYWFTQNWDSVPLKAWAEDQAGDGPYDWGLGYGATFSKGPDFKFTQLKVPEKKM